MSRRSRCAGLTSTTAGRLASSCRGTRKHTSSTSSSSRWTARRCRRSSVTTTPVGSRSWSGRRLFPVVRCTTSVRKVEMVMETTDRLDRTIVKELEAFLLERRARLQESVRARMAERRTGAPRRSPEDATNAVQSLGEDFEIAMLDRQSREAAQIDAALERLARDEHG